MEEQLAAGVREVLADRGIEAGEIELSRIPGGSGGGS